jgi:hypothetical protein
MARDEQPGCPYLEAIQRAFQFADAHGRSCEGFATSRTSP